ncbi:hypothetical protein KR093_011599, partial [Drosophila rubida]
MPWIVMSDEDYYNGVKRKNVRVPCRSVFSFMDAHEETLDPYLVNLPPKYDLYEIADEMLEKNEGAYMRVEIATYVFECIPSLLKVYSNWFAALKWNIDCVMLDERDVPPKGFKAIYKWMRTQHEIKYKHVLRALQAAKYLKIDLLETDLWAVLSKPEVREKQAFEVFSNSGSMALLGDVRGLMLSRIRKYFLPLVATKDFGKLHLDQLIDLLKLTSIGVNSEIEVLFAAVRWIIYNSRDRLQYMEDIMACVRFLYLPMCFLFALREGTIAKATDDINTPEFVLLQFARDRLMRTQLSEAMTFISMEMQSDDDTDTDTEAYGKRALARTKMPPRRWVYFASCKYHMSDLVYPHMHKFTYADFIDFIGSIGSEW